MKRDLQIDVVRQPVLGTGPTLVDNVGELLGDVDTPSVCPAILEPSLQFLAGIVIQNVDIQFTLALQTGERQIAAAKERNDWIVGILTEGKIELGMQSVT